MSRELNVQLNSICMFTLMSGVTWSLYFAKRCSTYILVCDFMSLAEGIVDTTFDDCDVFEKAEQLRKHLHLNIYI